jgi:hypothetical protein
MLRSRRTRGTGAPLDAGLDPALAPLEPEWPAPEGREEEARTFGRCLARAASGLPMLLLYEGRDAAEASALIGALAGSAHRYARVIAVGPAANERYDPVPLAIATLSKGWIGRLRRARIGQTGKKLLPDWLGVVPVVGNVVAAILVTLRTVLGRGRGRGAPVQPNDASELLRSAQRRPLALFVDALHQADADAAAAVCRLIHDAPVSARLLVTAALRVAPGQAPPPIIPLARGLAQDRVAVHRLAVSSAAVLGELEPVVAGARELLEAAAILGAEFDGGSLARLTRQDELEVEDRLSIAVRHGAIALAGTRTLEDGDITSVYRFATPALRASIIASMPAERRTALEQRVEETM